MDWRAFDQFCKRPDLEIEFHYRHQTITADSQELEKLAGHLPDHPINLRVTNPDDSSILRAIHLFTNLKHLTFEQAPPLTPESMKGQEKGTAKKRGQVHLLTRWDVLVD